MGVTQNDFWDDPALLWLLHYYTMLPSQQKNNFLIAK